MGIKIIGFGKSPTTLRVILTLQELGLEHEFEEGVYNEMKSPDFLATKNPFAKDVYYDAKRPNVVKWVKRIFERPAWKQIAANLNSD
ncbi:16294_t:CDS:2 [Entrophospora sp. SA101]|nr:16294_t:CDS:2 [Entrophospora sp. SA101]